MTAGWTLKAADLSGGGSTVQPAISAKQTEGLRPSQSEAKTCDRGRADRLALRYAKFVMVREFFLVFFVFVYGIFID